MTIATYSTTIYGNYSEKEWLRSPKPGMYKLSPKGERIIADVHNTSDTMDRLFKINVLLIAVDMRDNEILILNQRRTSQPSYGIVDVPRGTIMKAEPLLDGARRKLQEETGLHAENLELVGTTRRILYREGVLFSDVLFPICITYHTTGTPTTTKYGENF